MEEPIVDHLQKKPKKLTEGDKDQKRPDVVDVEHESGQENDNEVLLHEDPINDHLAVEATFALPVLLLFLFLGGQREDQVVHVEVADAVQDTLEDCLALRTTDKET